MNLLSNINKFLKQLNIVEQNIMNKKLTYLEIYEKNLTLEKEIALRANELVQANSTFLSLEAIWEMLNSEQPLSNVLETIVDSLKGEMGYLHSTILQKYEEDGLKYFLSKAESKSNFLENATTMINQNLRYIKIPYDDGNLFVESLKARKVVDTIDCFEKMQMLLPNVESKKVKDFIRVGKIGAMISIPIFPNKEEFGVLVVYSSRNDVTYNEKRFLSLFAHQVELALVIARLFERVKRQAVTDALTELYNRRYFEKCLQTEVQRAKRLNQPFSIISMDLDHLKMINDKYGHQYGDLAIQTISNVLKRNAREIDVPARFGGEEFNILLPSIDSKGAMIAAERIRSAIESEKIDTIGHVTASIGVVTFLEHTNRMDEILELADQAMYRAKLNGRNRVYCANTSVKTSWQQIAVEAFMQILSRQKLPISDDLAANLLEHLIQSEQEKCSKSLNTKELLFNISDSLSKTYILDSHSNCSKEKITLAVNFAKFIELEKDDIERLKVAMLLYDIGNILVPNEIFQKPGRLSEQERQKIHQHPVLAARKILEPISVVYDILPIIEKHHENWDGSGYPNKLSGRQIPIESQIILLVDAYFALISPRPHRNAYSQEQALEIINLESGKKWDKALVDKFLYMIKNEIKDET